MNNTAIKVQNVSKVYKLYDKPIDRLKESLSLTKKKYHKEFYALNDVSFEIKKGETVGIIGKNGAGKSTLLKIITGVLTPTSGHVHVNGRIASLLELGAGFNPEYTGIENIYLQGTLMGYSREEMEAKVGDIVAFADIGDFVHQPVKMYSSGMFARLAFAVAINVDPDILIVDEALSVGDMAFQYKCFKKFEEFKKNQKTILFVTHSLESIVKYCNLALVIQDGMKIDSGTPSEMVDIFKKSIVKTVDADRNDREHKKGTPAVAWKTNMHNNPNHQNYGNGAAEIVDYAIFDELGNLTTQLWQNEFYELRMRVVFSQKVSNPIFAFTIKLIDGLDISGTNTHELKYETGSFDIGDEVSICFRQKLTLAQRTYSLSLGCTNFENGEFVVYHRLYDVCFFEVLGLKGCVGFVEPDSAILIEHCGANV